MSKRKRNVAFIKPQEPAFLARLKEQVGYKEGPTVNTKREALPQYNSDDSDGEDPQPVIVVVNPGDLTAEQVARAKKESESEPADLEKRVVFKKPTKKRGAEETTTGGEGVAGKQPKPSQQSDKPLKKKRPEQPKTKGPLSFAEDPEEED